MTKWLIRLYALSIAAMSLKTFLAPQHGWPIKLLAGTEILMAILFALPKARQVGLYGLLTIFGLAAVLETLAGSGPFRFIVYGIAAWVLAKQETA
ncbi:hypothetical protein [Kordiimonas marina]|uniref:hypothetical protein n=1 Tax=Kordiimonas marina TaxID=2872312 RepID=UPI001FF3F9F6|nr:hypothetical protein [Kordiimonas marina]MCJ9428498.1 hypothetical protein [Kordiimonas marina]